MKLFHKLTHLLNRQEGHIISWKDDDQNIYIGFKCSVCGDISDINYFKFNEEKEPNYDDSTTDSTNSTT